MRQFCGLTKRNIMIYLKDVHTVIFSLLTSIIIFVLYLLFLKSNYTDAIHGAMTGLEAYLKSGDVDRFVDSLLLSGILGSALITVPFSCLGTIVKDRESGVDADVLATPIRRWQIILSYFTASTFCAFLMTTGILLVSLGMMQTQGGLYLDAMEILQLVGINLLGSFSSTALFMLVMLFFKSTSASGAFLGLLSAASGFVIGAYIPLSEFSEKIRHFCQLFPGTGLTIQYRELLGRGVLEQMNQDIGGLDDGRFVETLENVFCFEPQVFGHSVSMFQISVYILAIAAICTIAMILVYGKIYKKK